MPATTVINAASATTSLIVSEKRSMTSDARKQVIRLMPSHTARLRVAEASHALDRVVGFLADHVDDVVDRDAAEQLAVFIDDRRRDPVQTLEILRDFGLVHRHRDRVEVGDHDFFHGHVRIADEQLAQRQHANERIVAFDDEDVVRHLRNFVVPTQVTQHDVERVAATHGNRVGIQQAAGSILGIRQHGLEALAVLLVHRAQYLVDHLLGQVLQDVGEVVRVEAFGDANDFFWAQLAEDVRLHVVVEFIQDIAFIVLLDELPQHVTRACGRRFEQVGDGRGGQLVQHAAHLYEGAAFKCVSQRPKVIEAQQCFVMAGTVDHERTLG
jgi:hypothetical protein